MLIKEVKAREILDSRGFPTIEVELNTNNGEFRASVPSGTSIGKNEALELRDKNNRYCGLGVQKAVENINQKIAPKIKYLSPSNQTEIDKLLLKLDGTKDKSKLGANAILAVSIAVCKAGAGENNLPVYKHMAKLAKNKLIKIPQIMMLVIEGGKHADKSSDIQEFMINPIENNFKEALRKSTEVYHIIKEILKGKGFITSVGYEGAFPSPYSENEKVFDLILEGIKNSGYINEFHLAIDAAASEFFSNGRYFLDGKQLTYEDLLNIYYKWNENYPLSSIEDPFDEEDELAWKMISESIQDEIMIVGDDFLVTNTERIRKAIKQKLCNALLVKPNQIGTISETLYAVSLAQSAGWKIIVSHRSGETTDDFIANFAVGVGADYVKFGAPCRGERTAKYNELLRISEKIK